jgi:putative transposase
MIALPRSSYYYKPNGKAPDQKQLIDRIEALIEEFPGYGYRRVTRQLQREGVCINHKKVLRIMRLRGLTRKPKRRWVKTTDSNHSCTIYPNLLPYQPVSALNQVWVADITYISIISAFVYLAVILDLFSRKAIGYGIAKTLETSLCRSALMMAIATRRPPRNVIHHSDRGVQYASHEYVATLRSHHFQISMARKGNPYDNAAVESFMKTLKSEEVYLWEYRSLADVQKRLPHFIEQVYNRKRLHSSLGYKPPDEFEEQFLLHHNSQPPCLTT